MDGNIIVTNAAFSVGGVPIARGAHAFPITNGVVNIQLAPTDHASPAIVYTVNTVSNGQTSTSIWSVPTLPSSRCPSGTCTIVQVTTLYTPGPTTTVALSQLSTQGATNGQLICDSSGVAVWCNPPASGSHLVQRQDWRGLAFRERLQLQSARGRGFGRPTADRNPGRQHRRRQRRQHGFRIRRQPDERCASPAQCEARRGEQSVRRGQSSDCAVEPRRAPERYGHHLDRSVLQRAGNL